MDDCCCCCWKSILPRYLPDVMPVVSLRSSLLLRRLEGTLPLSRNCTDGDRSNLPEPGRYAGLVNSSLLLLLLLSAVYLALVKSSLAEGDRESRSRVDAFLLADRLVSSCLSIGRVMTVPSGKIKFWKSCTTNSDED
jgi:hypothetical protein